MSKNLSVPPFFKKMALKGVEPPSFIKDMILKGMPLSDPPLFVQEKFLRGEKLPDGRTFEPPKFIQNLLTRGITPKFLPGVVDPSQPQPAEEIREAMMLSDDEPPPGGLPFVFDAQYIANFMTDMLLSAYQPGPQGEVSS